MNKSCNTEVEIEKIPMKKKRKSGMTREKFYFRVIFESSDKVESHEVYAITEKSAIKTAKELSYLKTYELKEVIKL